MTEPLHVLVYGSLDDGACPVYRFGMHREALAGHGVELRGFTDYSVGVPEEALASPEAAFASRDLVLDRTGARPIGMPPGSGTGSRRPTASSGPCSRPSSSTPRSCAGAPSSTSRTTTC
jgi:hypothetical protein